jgi:SMODS-associating 2TM, beta-strand rich effector domain
MINYSLDTNSRPAVYFAIAAIALLAALLAGPMLDMAHAHWLAPSAFSLFGLGVYAFDHYGWKNPTIAAWLCVPDLAGKYSGTVERGAKDTPEYERYEVSVSITQTWTKIEMVLHSGDTVSHLRTCGFFVARGQFPSVLYTYGVKDLQGHAEASKYGEGTGELYISKDAETLQLSGAYYSTKCRKGAVKLVKHDG